jgi:2-methylcitrate dehydratase PrpD
MLTALAESGRYPIARLKTALLAAYEVAGLFDGLYGRFSAANGFRATSSYGILGAATAAAKFMGLNASQIAAALSTAASFAGGVLQSFVDGTDEWRYQVGIAAHNGWCAAGLAQAGAIASTRGFEGSAGFVKAFVRVDCDVDGLAARLGNEWSALRVTFKPYPVCAFNQTPVIAALRLRERLARRSIERVRIRMNPFETRYAGMNSRGPFNSISGTLMSTPFCVATTLVHGEPTIEHMTSYNDPRVTAAMAKVAVITDESVPNLSAVIEAELSTGELISHEQKMTPADYSYDWTATSQLVRRVGSEQGVDPQSYDRLETAILDLGDGSIEEIVRLFSKRDRSLQQATTRPAYTRGESAA